MSPAVAAYQASGLEGQHALTQVRLTAASTIYQNELGMFRVDDASGRIGNLFPGDPGYAAAALDPSRRVVLFHPGTHRNRTARADLESGAFYGYYLVAQGTARQLLRRNPKNRKIDGPIAYFSFTAANPDHRDHVRGMRGFGAAFEDVWGLGDADFNDAALEVVLGQPTGTVRSAPKSPVNAHAECAFPAELAGWVPAQTGGSGLGMGVVTEKDGEAVFREGDSFNVTLGRDFTVPADPSLVEFEVSSAFDRSSRGRMDDAFEAALLDDEGHPLTHTVAGSDAFFNLTEGQDPAFATGATLTGGHVTLDIGSLPAGTSAHLVFRLINNDGDTGSIVRLPCFMLAKGGDPNVKGALGAEAFSTGGEAIDFESLSDVTASLTAEYQQTSEDADSGEVRALLAVRNAGTYPVAGPLLAVVRNLSDPAVRVRDFDGLTPDGLPYYDLTNQLQADGLSPGEVADARRIAFHNPGGGQFTYDLDFLAQFNRAPGFTSEPKTEALPDVPYAYNAIATDPDRDALSFSVLSGPPGLSVDAGTGQVTWRPQDGDLGAHAVALQVDDGRGGTAEQDFLVSVIVAPPNRPPLVTSSPVVDGNVGTPYRYQATAADADGDPLAFAVVSGPDGLAVDAASGLVSWTPTVGQLGDSNVTLQVSDGRGGTALQVYTIGVQATKGNHAPVITSAPVTGFNLGKQVPLLAASVTIPGSDPGNNGPVLLYSLEGEGPLVSLPSIPGRPLVDDPQGAAFSAQGELFVGNRSGNVGHGVGSISRFVFDASGTYIPNGSITGNGLEDVAGLAFSQTGELFAADYLSDTISRFTFDVNGNAIPNGTIPLHDPGALLEGVAVSPAGELFAAEYGQVRRFVFDASGAAIPHGSFTVPGAGRFHDLGFSPAGELFLPALDNSTVYRFTFDSAGNPVSHGALSVPNPVGVAFSPLGELFVSSHVGGGISRFLFDVNGNAVPHGFMPTESLGQLAFGFFGGSEYQYPVQALDPDDDSLTYSLTTAPAGMTIDPDGGLITWSGPAASASAPGPIPSNGMTLTADGAAAGFSLTDFARDFPTDNVTGPFGIAFPTSGSVLVSDIAGNVRRFPTDTDGQKAADVAAAQNYGPGRAFDMAQAGSAIYMTQRDSGNLIQLNEDGTFNQTIVSGLARPHGIVVNPSNGHLIVSSYTENNIYDVDPAARTSAVLFHASLDGISMSPDGSILYGAAAPQGIDHVYGYSLLPGSLGSVVFDSGVVAGDPDGTALGVGTLAGNIFVNTNQGTVIEINLLTHVQTIIASGGTRGDFVTVDPNDGTLLLTQTKNVVRLRPPAGASFAQDFKVAVRADDGRGGSDTQNFVVHVTNDQTGEIHGTVFADANPSSGLVSWWRAEGDATDSVDGNNGTLQGGVTFAPGVVGQALQFDGGTGEVVVPDSSNLDFGPTSPITVSLWAFRTSTAPVQHLLGKRQGSTLNNNDMDYQLVLDNRNGFGLAFGSLSGGVGSRQDMPLNTWMHLAATFDGSTWGFYIDGVLVSAGTGGTLGPANDAPFTIGTSGTAEPFGGLIDEVTIYHRALSAGEIQALFHAGGTSNPVGSPGRTVYLDQNRNEQRDPGELFTTSAADGSYSFTGLTPGAYRVVEEGQQGWRLTAPVDRFWEIIITPGAVSVGVDFSNTQSGVVPGNRPPAFTSSAPTTAVVGQTLLSRAAATDPDGDPLAFDLPVKPAGMTVDPATGAVVWTPTADQVGVQHVLLRVQDGHGGVDLQAFQVVVSTNAAPIITSTPPGPATAGLPYQYPVRAQDADGDPLTFRLDAAPVGMLLDATTGLLTWTPTDTQLGRYLVAITVSDGRGGQTTQSFELAVATSAPNDPPVITSVPRTTVRLGNQYFDMVEAADPNGDPLTYHLDVAPAGMTIDAAGVVLWEPAVAQFGPNPVTLRVEDGRGGSTSQAFTVNVVAQGTTLPPTILSTAPLSATVDRLYSYNLAGADPEDDPLVWSLDTAPVGMSIDPGRGTLRWTPVIDQVGTQDVVVRVQDTQGGSATQSFSITVRSVNVPPGITSITSTQATVGQLYTYAVQAIDVENDPLAFSLSAAPAGMAIDPTTGLIQWTPDPTQVGAATVEIQVADGQGGFVGQSYTLVVSDPSPNSPPVITSFPPMRATVGVLYQYQVVATDPDGDPLHYELLAPPGGMTIDPGTGLIQWTPTPFDTSEIAQVIVTVADPAGHVAGQIYGILVRDTNHSPTIASSPVEQVTAGQTYRYDAQATDADGDPLTYTIQSGPSGMTVDAFGRVRWSPAVSDIGTHHIDIAVADARGLSVTQSYNLSVVADTLAPKVGLSVSANPADLGAPVTFVVLATDNVGVTGRTLTIAGVHVPLDANNRATVTMTTAGAIEVVATAADAAGNSGMAAGTLLVIDPSDTEAPVIDLTTPAKDAVITAPTDVIGTVTDDNLLFYTLGVAPVGSDTFTEIARGTNPVVDGVLGKFDPSMLAADSYVLRLTAVDAGGHTVRVQRTISVAGNLKLGNFALSFTDLSIPVEGIPITVTRTYDTLSADEQGDFGFGWRLEFRDVNLRTSVPKTGMEADGIYNPFRDGTRVYLTLPGGKREGFTFQPQLVPFMQYLIPLGLPRDSWLYDPVFVPDPGVTDRLTVSGATTLVQDTTTGEYFSIAAGRIPFNPADPIYFGTYVLTMKEGVAFHIDAPTAKLTRVTDRNGNEVTLSDEAVTGSAGVRVTFERDPQGRIISITDPSSRQVRYQYDAGGDLVAVTDPEGNTTRFVYRADPPHYLDQVTDPLGRAGVRAAYDGDGRLVQLIEAAGHAVELAYDLDHSVETVRDALGNPTAFEYDDHGNVLTEIDATGGITRRTYDAADNLLSETDPLGNRRTFTYEAAGNVTTVTDPLGNTTRYTSNASGHRLTVTDPLGNTTVNTYDDRDNLVATRDAAGNVTTHTVDPCGCVSAITDALGNVTHFEYDAAGRRTAMTDALGHETRFTNDASGNLLSESFTVSTPGGPRTLTTARTYDGLGRVTAVTDPEDRTRQTRYDALGNTVAILDAAGQRTELRYDERGLITQTLYADGTTEAFTYDAAGRQVAITDHAGQTTAFVLDALGRRVETVYPDDTPETLADNPRLRTEYDAAGQVTAEIDERGNRTEYEYDAAGRRILVRDALGNVTRFAYDAAGRQVAQTDALGHETRFVYDATGRLVQTRFADGTTTTTAHDALGRVTAETDQAGNTTHFTYDALGRLVAVVDALGGRTEYSYDEAGNLVAQKDANGHVTRYEYDGSGHRTATVLPLGQRSLTAFDLAGNAESTTDGNGVTIHFEHDAAGRVVAERYPDGTSVIYTDTASGQRATATDRQGGVTRYTYDVRDRLVSRTDPDGSTIAYTYDAAGNRTAVTVPSGTTRYAFDALDRLQTVTDPDGGVTHYTYDAGGNLVRTELPNGVIETRAYDALNRLVSLEQTGPAGVLAGYHYTLGPTGFRTAVEESSGRRVDYTYDALSRLTGESIADPVAGNRTISYTYDPVGNRLSRSDSAEGATTYQYDDNDRLLVEATGGRETQYTYDDNGNTLSCVSAPFDQAFFTYDENGRLLRTDVTDAAGTHRTEYRYDTDGLRVASIVDGTETRFLLDQNRPYAEVLEEYSPAGSTQAVYVHGLDLISQERDGQQSFYLPDGLGSTRLLADGTGAVTDRYVYDAFGRLLEQSGTTVNPHLFTGERRDPLTGLDYLQARSYDPQTGRFFGADPVAGIPRNPPSRHRFLYTEDNPVNFTDPSGRFLLLEVSITLTIEANLEKLPQIFAKNLVKGFLQSVQIAFCVVEPANILQSLGLQMVSNGFPDGYAIYNQGRSLAAQGYRQISEALGQVYVNTLRDLLKIKWSVNVSIDHKIFELIEKARAAYDAVNDQIEQLQEWRDKFNQFMDDLDALLHSPNNCSWAEALNRLGGQVIDKAAEALNDEEE